MACSPLVRAIAFGLVCGSGLPALPVRAGTAEEACRSLTGLVRADDRARARELLAHTTGAGQPVIATTRLERILLGALLDDHRFLIELRDPYQEDLGDAACAQDGRYYLLMALQAQAAVARQRAREAAALAAEDRALALLAVEWAARSDGERAAGPRVLETRAEQFLQEYPATRYREFLLATMVYRLRPGRFGMEMVGHGGALGFDAATRERFSGRAGFGLAIAVDIRPLQFGIRVARGDVGLRQTITRDGMTWAPGANANWLTVEGTAGFRYHWGRHGALLVAGLGDQQLILDPRGQARSITFFNGSVHAGYDFSILRVDPPREYLHLNSLQRGMFARVELSLLGALQRRDIGGPVAPRAWMAQVGIGVEARALERLYR